MQPVLLSVVCATALAQAAPEIVLTLEPSPDISLREGPAPVDFSETRSLLSRNARHGFMQLDFPGPGYRRLRDWIGHSPWESPFGRRPE